MNREKKVNNKRNGIIILCIFLAVCLIGYIKTYIINKRGVYVITTVHGVKGARSGNSFFFRYNYKGKEYNGAATGSDIYKSDEGKRFFLNILPNNPDIRKMTNIRVPDSIIEAPYEGWKELPIQVQE